MHGHGTGDLLDAVLEHLPEEKEEEDEGEIIKVAVIGKPNVGKSSLVNRVSGENRCIVSNIAGTTRDAVDTTIENKYGVFTFIDTAGLRRKSKVEDSIEHYSNLRAEMAVDRADAVSYTHLVLCALVLFKGRRGCCDRYGAVRCGNSCGGAEK